jgi:hypothetical protein
VTHDRDDSTTLLLVAALVVEAIVARRLNVAPPSDTRFAARRISAGAGVGAIDLRSGLIAAEREYTVARRPNHR